MDEHPAAGVFFGNNSVLSGTAGGPGLGGRSLPPPPAQQQQQQLGVEGEAQRPQYNIPGILHFLQHEWARFEVERTQWEVDRAELQVGRPPREQGVGVCVWVGGRTEVGRASRLGLGYSLRVRRHSEA